MPEQTLVPDAVLAAFAMHTGPVRTVAPLSGGLTNRNYRLDAAAGAFVLRMAGDKTVLLGINREHEFACAFAAHGVGVGPLPCAYDAQQQALLTHFVPAAETLSAESIDPARLARIVSVLRRVHAGPGFPGVFDPFATVRAYHTLALTHAVAFPVWLPEVFARMRQIEATLAPHAVRVPCHNDLLPANFLDDGRKIWLIDWEYAGTGDRCFDLGNFAANMALDAAGCEHLLTLYFGMCTPARLAQLNLMRLASDLREAFWGYLQSGISDLDVDFVAYGRGYLERFRAGATGAEYTEWLAALA